jgi:hypothetical protein
MSEAAAVSSDAFDAVTPPASAYAAAARRCRQPTMPTPPPMPRYRYHSPQQRQLPHSIAPVFFVSHRIFAFIFHFFTQQPPVFRDSLFG